MKNRENYKVSIIIPHYNIPEFLKKLLDTIPDKEDIQTIVIDDNSTKQIELYNDLVEEYGNRVEFYKNNSGVQSAGACRNIGLGYAKGAWVLFADADDFFMPHMYTSISKYFESDCEMVIFCPTSIFIDSGKIADRHVVYEKRINDYLINPTYENLLQIKRLKEPWTKLIRRSVIEKYRLRFSETLHNNDMYFITMANFYCEKTEVSRDVIYCITRNRGSLTTKVNETAFDLSVAEFIKCYKFAKDNYDKRSFKILNMNGGIIIFKAYKRKLGVKKILQTLKLFKANKIPLLSEQMKNPIYLIKVIIFNNRIIDREKSYYVYNKNTK